MGQDSRKSYLSISIVFILGVVTLREKKWVFAVLLSIVILLLKCSMPIYSDSFFATGTDSGRHFIVAEAIKQSGSIVYPTLWYLYYPPAFHVFTSITSDVLGLPLDIVFNLFSVIIVLLCTLFVYIFCKTLFCDEKLSILSIVLLNIAMVPPRPQPSVMVIYLLIPLAIFTILKYIRYGSKWWLAVFCITITSLFLTHNASALYFLGVLFLFAILSLMSKDRDHNLRGLDIFTTSLFLFTISFFCIYAPLTPSIQDAIRLYFLRGNIGGISHYLTTYYPIFFLLIFSSTVFYVIFRHKFIDILREKLNIVTSFSVCIFRGVAISNIPLLLFLLVIGFIMVFVTFFLGYFFIPPLPSQLIKTGISPWNFFYMENSLYSALTSFQNSSFLILIILGIIGIIKRSKEHIGLDFPVICLTLPLILATPLALFIKHPMISNSEIPTRYIYYSIFPLAIFSSVGIREVLIRIRDESKRGAFLSLLLLLSILLSSISTISSSNIDNYKESGYNWIKSDTGVLVVDESDGKYINPSGYRHTYKLFPKYSFSIGQKIRVNIQMKRSNEGHLVICQVHTFGREWHVEYFMKQKPPISYTDDLIYSNGRMHIYKEYI